MVEYGLTIFKTIVKESVRNKPFPSVCLPPISSYHHLLNDVFLAIFHHLISSFLVYLLSFHPRCLIAAQILTFSAMVNMSLVSFIICKMNSVLYHLHAQRSSKYKVYVKNKTIYSCQLN